MTDRGGESNRRDAWLRAVLSELEEEMKSWPPEMLEAVERLRQERLAEVRRIKERKHRYAAGHA